MKNKPKKKNKLPSGNYRLQVYDYTDANGKKHYKSFTAPTKREAQLLAAEWKVNRSTQQEEVSAVEQLSLYDAISRYMDVKKGVLSPSTIRGYVGVQENYFKNSFGETSLQDLTNPSIQLWISDLAAKLSPKTVRNAFGLLSATLDMFYPDFRIKVTLPQKKKAELYCPSDQDIRRLLDCIHDTELEIAVLLAAFGPLRRGEICALTASDVCGNTIHVRHSMVKGPDKEWYIKEPKTPESNRVVEMPDFVIERIQHRTGSLVKMNPDYITHKFGRTLKRINVPHFRFHDLRHYSASIMHAIGVPDQYIMARGGWKTDTVLKSTYRNVIDIETARQNKKINQHFCEVSHDVSHEARKAL